MRNKFMPVLAVVGVTALVVPGVQAAQNEPIKECLAKAQNDYERSQCYWNRPKKSGR